MVIKIRFLARELEKGAAGEMSGDPAAWSVEEVVAWISGWYTDDNAARVSAHCIHPDCF